MNRPLFYAFACLLFTLTSTVTRAQEVPIPDVTLPEVGETAALERGDRAPWAGMLVRDEDLFGIQTRTMTLQLELGQARRLYEEAVTGRAALLETASGLCEQRVELHTSLWRERQGELVRAVEDARRAGERDWTSEPALWFALGAIVAGALGIGVVAAVSG